MANCPKCNQEWLWDWCIDTYRTSTGEKCKELVLTEVSRNQAIEFRCMCDQLLGISRAGGTGVFITKHPSEWADIDWDTEEHSYQGDCNETLKPDFHDDRKPWEDTDDTT